MSQWVNLVWPPPVPSGMICFSYTLASKTRDGDKDSSANTSQSLEKSDRAPVFGSYGGVDGGIDSGAHSGVYSNENEKHIRVSSLPTTPRSSRSTLLGSVSPQHQLPTSVPQQQNIDLTLIRRLPKRTSEKPDMVTNTVARIDTVTPIRTDAIADQLPVNQPRTQISTTTNNRKPYDVARYSLPIVPHHNPSSSEKRNLQMPHGTFFIAPNGQRIHLTPSQRRWWKNGLVPGQIQ